MAGSVDLVQRCFTGMEIRADRLIFNPRWPEELGELSFSIMYRGHRLAVRISAGEIEIAAAPGSAASVEIHCGGMTELLAAGATVRMPILAGGLGSRTDQAPADRHPAGERTRDDENVSR